MTTMRLTVWSAARRMMVWSAAGLLIGSLSGPSAWAEEPPSTQREREIREHEAQRYAEQHAGELDKARAQLEEAEHRYQYLAQQYEQAKATYEQQGRARFDEDMAQGLSVEATEARAADLERRLHELRVREVELQATMQQLEISGRPKDAEGLQRELIEIHKESQMTMLELEQQQRELERLHERRELGHMQDRLNFIGHWRDVAFDSQQAIMMATQSLVEMHVGSGDAAAAAQTLERLLTKIDWVGARTALRFALKDLYGELEKPDQAKEQMIQVILENAGGKDDE